MHITVRSRVTALSALKVKLYEVDIGEAAMEISQKFIIIDVKKPLSAAQGSLIIRKYFRLNCFFDSAPHWINTHTPPKEEAAEIKGRREAEGPGILSRLLISNIPSIPNGISAEKSPITH